MRTLPFAWPLLLLIVLAHGQGCGEGGQSPEAEEAARKLDEAERRLEEAKARLEEAESKQDQPVADTPFVPPGEFVEPFDVSFGFGDRSKVDYYLTWNHSWQFSSEHAVNEKWNDETFIASRYILSGDFSVWISGKMSKSYKNSRRPHLLVAGQEIQLTPNP